MHSEPREVTEQDKEAGKTPPGIAKGKKSMGGTSALDTRRAAEGREWLPGGLRSGEQEVAALAKALKRQRQRWCRWAGLTGVPGLGICCRDAAGGLDVTAG